ncbi:MazG nucleotide pyrophosphohydrolase domain-containing protein [Brevibacterium sp. VCM10]|uniref:MazG nucleotide pyrophosphohydrolase domain-containing protein n=1 Tax=Brevibacterium sp. VCM10 TaxID=1381751 RepID=UPI00046F1188|nr:MazG nucleotide pyrophosphohydrolase domain-containing protein [Brevibacterium sp. VCM10]
MGERDDQGTDRIGPSQAEPRLQPVIDAMAALRRRCPWSSRQDHQSLEKYAREETDELIDALEDFTTAPTPENRAAVIEELGDVFYQVLFHSALLDERSGQVYGHSLGAIIDGLEAKLIRRHPLAFTGDSGDEMASLDDVEREYRRIKAEEKAAVRDEDRTP